MNRWARLACGALFALAFIRLDDISPAIEQGTLPIEPPTPYLHVTAQGESRGRVLVVHGLAASKELMRIFATAVADAGFDVDAIDFPGHGDSPVGFTYERAKQALEHTLARLGRDSIVVGHSMGAALLLDVAGTQKLSTMVLFSPPPIPTADVQSDRLLVVSGEWDIPRINEFIPQIAGDTPQAEWWRFSGAFHTTALFNHSQTQQVAQWMGGNPDRVRTAERMALVLTMLVAGAAAGILALWKRKPEDRSPGLEAPNLSTVLLSYIVAAAAAALVLRLVVVLEWIRLFAFDYLVSFLLVAGLLLWRGRRLQVEPAALAVALLATAYVILVLGLLSGSHLIHLQLSNGRWWRFPILTAAGFPLLVFDELALRSIRPFWKQAGAAILTRILLGALIITGVLVLNRDDAFLVLIMHFVVVFWITLWFAASVVYRSTRDPLSSALFAALVQGWAFAAVFVTV